MELRQIEYFSAVNRYKNYTKAAQELHVSQPTISVAIQKLEDELGIKLMERDNKGIRITGAGEIFLAKGEKVLDEIRDLEEIMEDLKPSGKKHLKAAFPSTVGSWLWKVLLRKFPKEYPDIELELSDLGTMDIVTLLKQEELEVGYGVIDLIHDGEIESRAIRGGELKMIVSCSHPFASQPMISIDMLENEPIIMYRMGSTYTERLLLENMKRAGVHPSLRYVREQSTVFDMVAQECGIAAVLDDQVSAIRDNPKITAKRFARPIEFETGLMWNRNKYLSGSARKFIDFIGRYQDK